MIRKILMKVNGLNGNYILMRGGLNMPIPLSDLFTENYTKVWLDKKYYYEHKQAFDDVISINNYIYADEDKKYVYFEKRGI